METLERAGEQSATALAELRRISREAHEAVDEAFSRFDLSDPKSYRAFLTAHACVLGAAESYLSRHVAALPVWRPRAELLEDDLRQMGLGVPAVQGEHFSDCDGTAMGVLYVLEGSRLGGRVLSGRVAKDLPKTYLSAFHQKGEWPAFLEQLGRYLDESDAARRQAVIDGAVATFALFEKSAVLQD